MYIYKLFMNETDSMSMFMNYYWLISKYQLFYIK